MKLAAGLFLLFTLVPTLETWLLIEVGSRLGAATTTLTLVLAGLIGAWLGKRAGGTVLRELVEGLRRGEAPAEKIVEGVLALVGGVLLVTPGYLSDAVGLLLLWQPTRRWLAPRVKARLWGWLGARGFTFVGSGAAAPPPRAPGQANAQFDHPVSE